ncbi:hypothetical protein GCM10009555_024050 [Acrocarpospora macrocephala]|uniref:Uncharacterized protein n=1 Tax=Acrocarpospora macrocephala TaxID=150177 RepID=A0A5M3WSH5_9ACTN|nr:WD40 repeat domain-containing protein [Acrocarpospora macrocephala]GES12337.1 hypothetical protein Amac_059340 [Acrocarpospora macrocephala]
MSLNQADSLDDILGDGRPDRDERLLCDEFLGPEQPLPGLLARLVADRDTASLQRLHHGETRLHAALNEPLGYHGLVDRRIVEELGPPFQASDKPTVHALRSLAGLALSLVEEERAEEYLRKALLWHAAAHGSPLSDQWTGHDDTRQLEILTALAGDDRRLAGAAPAIAVTLRTLAGRPPEGRRLTGPRVLLDLADQGWHAQLKATLVRDSPRGLVPDPRRMSLFIADERFQIALGRAWSQAGEKITGTVLWSLERTEGPLGEVEGESLGAAFAVLLDELRSLRRPFYLPPPIWRLVSANAVVGKIDDLGNMRSVGGYERKLQAAGKNARVIVPTPDQQEAEAAGQDVVIVPAPNWHIAARQARRPNIWPFAGWIAVPLAVALIAVGTLWIKDSREKQQTIEARRKEALSRLTTLRSDEVRTADPVLSGLLSLAAWKFHATPEAGYGMKAVVATSVRAVLSGHEDRVRAVAYSSDGAILATASDDGTVRLWDTATRRPLGRPLAHDNDVYAVAFSPDGKTLATAGRDNAARLWDVATQRPIGQPFVHKDDVYAVAFSPDGTTLATGNGDGITRLWNLTGDPHAEPLPGRHVGAVFALAFSPDGETLATGGFDNTARLWHVDTRRPAGPPLEGHTNEVRAVAFSPDGKTLATTAFDSTARLWDVPAQRPIGEPLTHPGSVSSVAFSPDGTTLLTGSFDGTARFWDVETRQSIGTPLTGHTDLIDAVAFSPDGTTVATAGDTTARLWTVAAHRPTGELRHERISDAAFSPDGRTIATGGGTTARLWGAATRAPLAHTGEVGGVAFSPDGKILAVASDRNVSARLWDVATGNPIGPAREGLIGVIGTVSFSPDAAMVATAGLGPVRLWTVPGGEPIGPALQDGGVLGAAFSPAGKILATANSDKTVRLWDVTTRQEVCPPLRGHTSSVADLAFSPDGRILATAGGLEDTVRLWDVRGCRAIGDPLDNGDAVWDVAFGPDGGYLVTASSNGTLQLWDMATRRRLGDPRPHPGGVKAVAFSPDGKTVASAGRDSARLWAMTLPADPSSLICEIAGRSLTLEEWQRYIPTEPFRKICP